MKIFAVIFTLFVSSIFLAQENQSVPNDKQDETELEKYFEAIQNYEKENIDIVIKDYDLKDNTCTDLYYEYLDKIKLTEAKLYEHRKELKDIAEQNTESSSEYIKKQDRLISKLGSSLELHESNFYMLQMFNRCAEHFQNKKESIKAIIN